jgi:hypothetical protein
VRLNGFHEVDLSGIGVGKDSGHGLDRSAPITLKRKQTNLIREITSLKTRRNEQQRARTNSHSNEFDLLFRAGASSDLVPAGRRHITE